MKNILFIATMALAASFSVAHAEEIICPDTISVKQTIKGTHKGFTPYTQEIDQSVSAITLFDGEPEQLASLKPDNGDERADVYKYTLKPSANYWVLCQYGFTTLSLKQKIKSTVSSCESHMDRNKMVCK